MAINKTSQEARVQIRNKTSYALPNNPTKVGMSPLQIKNMLGYLAILDQDNSIMAELDRIIDEANNVLDNDDARIVALINDVGNKSNLTTTQKDNLVNAINEIVELYLSLKEIALTHATKTELATETETRANSDVAMNNAIVANKSVVDKILDGITTVPKATSATNANNDSNGKEIDVEKYIANFDINYDSENATINFVAKNSDGDVKYVKSLILPKESFVSNGYYDKENHEIVLVMNNGNVIRFSASDLIDTYSGDSTSSTIETIVDGRTIKANLKNGSVTRKHLSPDIVTIWDEYDNNETVRQASEEARELNEATRVNNESTRQTTEGVRQSNETARINAEQTRVSNELIRSSNEETRESNETSRESNEALREESESTRKTNEQGRVTAEANRVVAEQTRVSNESTRVNNETSRVTAEANRVSNESERQLNEEVRQTGYGRMAKLHEDLQEVITNWEEYAQGFVDRFVTKESIVDNLESTATDVPLSANQGRVLKGLIDAINTVLHSDDTDLDTIQEIVAYIKENRETLETLETLNGIVNVSDIVDNLTSTDTNKPLSANQGKVLDEKITTANTNITNAINTAKGYTDDKITELNNVYQPLGNYQPLGDYVTTTTFDSYKTEVTNNFNNKVGFSDVVSATSNGACPAYSDTNKSSVKMLSTQYVLANDGKWHQLPDNAFSNTTYTTATSSALGLIKVGYTNNGNNYKVQVDSSGNAYVYVPWENTTYDLSVYVTQTELENKGYLVAGDISSKADIASTGNKLSLSMDTSTYVITLKLLNSSDEVLSTQSIDLPLESVVVNGSYDATNKKISLTLKNGSTVSFSVADLVSGLQTELSSSNKLPVEYIDGISDYATKEYVDESIPDVSDFATNLAMGTCSTSASTAIKVVTLSGFTLKTNVTFTVRFTYAWSNASQTQLNVNSTGAKIVLLDGATVTGSGVIHASDTVTFKYDGTYYRIISIARPQYTVNGVTTLTTYSENVSLGTSWQSISFTPGTYSYLLITWKKGSEYTTSVISKSAYDNSTSSIPVTFGWGDNNNYLLVYKYSTTAMYAKRAGNTDVTIVDIEKINIGSTTIS